MKKIKTYIFESLTKDSVEYAMKHEGVKLIGGKCGWWSTADKFNDWLFNDSYGIKVKNKMFKHSSDDEIKQLIINAYKACEKKYGDDLTYDKVPFVINTPKNGRTPEFYLRRNNANLADIKALGLSGYSNKFETMHNGFGSRASNGLKFEETLLRSLINGVMNELDEDSDDNSDRCAIELLKRTEVKLVIDKILKITGTDEDKIKEYIFQTGSSDTSRLGKKDDYIIDLANTQNIINNNKEFNDILLSSGKKISDITIKDPESEINNIYISCKSGAAQLSGIAFNNVFYHNGLRKKDEELFNLKNDFLTKDLSYKNPLLSPLHGLCRLFGASFTKIRDFYYALKPDDIDKNPYDYNTNQETDKQGPKNIKFSNEFCGSISDDDLILLKKIILFIIGSNYYYVNEVKPEKILYINITDDFIDDMDLRLNEMGISDSGKTIKRKCKLNDQNFNLVFRTSDGTYRYPYRLFIDQFNVIKFMENINKV